MKVLVTGNGLLGTAIRKFAVDFIYAERFWDLRQSKKAEWLVQTYKPEVIIHTAARVGGVKLNSEKPETMFYDNFVITSNLIHYAATNGVKKFIGFGSTCTFDGEINEERTQDGKPFKNNYAYGYAKRMVEIHLMAAKEQYGMDYSYYVPCSLYGPNDLFNLDEAHVIPSLIHKFYLGEMKVWGDGTPLREVMFAEDLAKIVLELIDKDTGTVVVGNGQEVSVKEMADTIAKELKCDKEIEWTGNEKGQKRREMVNAAKLKGLLPDFKFTSFQDGIKKTVNWFVENYPEVRR